MVWLLWKPDLQVSAVREKEGIIVMQINQDVTTSRADVQKPKLTYETQAVKDIDILLRNGGRPDILYIAASKGYDEVRASYDMDKGIFQVLYYNNGKAQERMDYQLDIIQSVGVEYE